ncbi:MAG: 4-alpha-glucanotransferase [Candidatus Peregrinibacteria bacterium Greene0416_19]|nr:MAG: 4-alpha-glucanotransferase [Candidatus Peregrinibacteria bacterium Greene0416_19]
MHHVSNFYGNLIVLKSQEIWYNHEISCNFSQPKNIHPPVAFHTLMFGWEYPPLHSGGLGVACQGLVRGLMRNGVQVTLVLPHASGQAEPGLDIRFPTDEQCATVNVPSLLQPYDGSASYRNRLSAACVPQEVGELYGQDLGEAVERFTALSVELTKNTDPDVVHCHDWMTYDAGIRAARHHERPLVAHVHATEFDRTDFHPNEWIAGRERHGLLAADRIIAVSGYTRNMLVQHYGIPEDKIAVVHNGHDAERIEATDILQSQYGGTERPLVLFLGRLTVQKNPWQFLEIAHRIHAIDPHVQFVLAGDGPMLGTLIERTCDLGLQDTVIFTGKLSQPEVRSLFTRANCFVMPSLSEPFGLVALEAIAHNTPVIISRQSGVAEVLDHAFKVDYWDADKMADCILTILREKPLADQLVSEAPGILRRLSWQNQAAHVRSIYHQLIQ